MSEVKIYDATDLDKGQWRQLQSIQREAFTTTLDRTQQEIDALVGWNEPDDFYASHVDPNSEIDKRYNADQSYSKPRVAIATEASQPVGYAYSAHNVSGATERERSLKRLSVVKNYLWLREVAVKPEFQNQGIARKLGKTLLKDAIPLQPPTAYVWPDEIDFLQGALEKQGFVSTGEQAVKVFGEDSSPIRQVRLQAKSAQSVLSKM